MSIRRKAQRTSDKKTCSGILYYETGNRSLRRAIKNRRVANPDRVDQLGSVTYIKALSR